MKLSLVVFLSLFAMNAHASYCEGTNECDEEQSQSPSSDYAYSCEIKLNDTNVMNISGSKAHVDAMLPEAQKMIRATPSDVVRFHCQFN